MTVLSSSLFTTHQPLCLPQVLLAMIFMLEDGEMSVLGVWD